MTQQLNSMLNYATGMQNPLQLKVKAMDGTETLFESTKSYVVIGRGDGADIQLPEQQVSFRHAYLQVIGSRVAYVDLLSTAGVQIFGAPFNGWVNSSHLIRIGSSEISVVGDTGSIDETLPSPLSFRPKDEFRPEFGYLPIVELELLNTPHKGMRWPINRVITLVGKDDRCRITVGDDRLSRVHCGLLLLPSGLWVIDLSGTNGVMLNGVQSHCGLLTPGVELEIGPYKLIAHYSPCPFQPAVSPIKTNASDFITRSNRIFQTETYNDTLILYPVDDGQGFLFKDVHQEANRVSDLIQQRGLPNLVVDFSRTQTLPFIVIEGLNAICRTAMGRKSVCGLNDATSSLIQTSPFIKSLPSYATLTDAIQAIYVPVST